MLNNLTVAVTGGIGSGKSQAIAEIKKLGHTVYSLDAIYADLLKEWDFLDKVCKIAGVPPIKDEKGDYTLDRKGAARAVYGDAEKLKKLNEFTHPAIMREFYKRAQSAAGVVFCEVPLLYESGLSHEFDYIFVIRRPLEERIVSAMARDEKTREAVISAIKNQFDYTKLVPDEHTIVIENDGTIDALGARIGEEIQKILS